MNQIWLNTPEAEKGKKRLTLHKNQTRSDVKFHLNTFLEQTKDHIMEFENIVFANWCLLLTSWIDQKRLLLLL